MISAGLWAGCVWRRFCRCFATRYDIYGPVRVAKDRRYQSDHHIAYLCCRLDGRGQCHGADPI